MQLAAMHRLLTVPSIAVMSKNGEHPLDVFRWRGVTYENGRIVEIHWGEMCPLALRNLHWFPSTVRVIRLTHQQSHCKINTRLLPKCLEHFNVDRGSIMGSIDLRTLPPRIVVFAVVDNLLTGTVDLTNLPQAITIINLGNNRIDAVIGRLGCLPESLESANFSATYEDSRIASIIQLRNRPVKYLSQDGFPMDEQIELNLLSTPAYMVEKSILPFRGDTVHDF